MLPFPPSGPKRGAADCCWGRLCYKRSCPHLPVQSEEQTNLSLAHLVLPEGTQEEELMVCTTCHQGALMSSIFVRRELLKDQISFLRRSRFIPTILDPPFLGAWFHSSTALAPAGLLRPLHLCEVFGKTVTTVKHVR